jgi:hypothetical protein
MEDYFDWYDVLVVADYDQLIRMILRPLFVVQHFDFKISFLLLKYEIEILPEKKNVVLYFFFVLLIVNVKKKDVTNHNAFVTVILSRLSNQYSYAGTVAKSPKGIY